MGIFGFLAMLSNTFFIDNENKNKIIEYNHLIQKKLKAGENFIIFRKVRRLMETVLRISNLLCLSALLTTITRLKFSQFQYVIQS